MKLSVIKTSRVWFILSGALVVLSVVFVFVPGLTFGIDFTGGSLSEVIFEQIPSVSELRTSVETAGYRDATLQATDDGYLIRTTSLTEEEHQSLLTQLRDTHGTLEERRFDSIGPVIGNELRRTALIGVALTLVLIGLYVAWAYRKVSEPVDSWKYGAITILAALHDVIITVGAFSLLGYFFGWEIGSSFVAAVLTILGYSINDTVVVFDRTRENLLKGVGDGFADTVERSIEQTLTRSLFTSLTTILALLAIFLLGGESTRSFALALIIGISVGTYSSIFLASPLLVAWEGRGKNSSET
ncbi:protein translocase subunit SecF [Candidatus Parcubacteria bacterium]|nr:protein translocase subunit SecF [Candidatus Parcubacteria bacterium]